MSVRDPYSLLGVPETASDEVIKQAYLRMTRIVHPDRFDPKRQPNEWKDANDLLQAINEAYSTLKDEKKRANFDRKRRQGFQSAEAETKVRPQQGGDSKTEDGPTPYTPKGSTHGHSNFRDLPEAVRKRLRDRQSGHVHEQSWAETDRETRHFVGAFFFCLWFVILALLAKASRWEHSTITWTLIGTAFVAILIGSRAFRIFHLLFSRISPRLYVTPLYLIETGGDSDIGSNIIRWWPIWTIRDIKTTHKYSNGTYMHTEVKFKFTDSEAEFDLSPSSNAEGVLSALRHYHEALQRVISASQWDYFAIYDDFRGIVSTPMKNSRISRRLVYMLADLVIAMIVYGIIYDQNSILPSKKGPPPISRQLPEPIRRDSAVAARSRVSPTPSIQSTPLFLEPVQPLPRNGQFNQYTYRMPLAPLEIKTRSQGHHYFVKLVDSATDTAVLTVFVRDGESVNVDVPLGSMKMRYAVGRNWYGEKLLFGPETSYAEADSTFDFSSVGDEYRGYTVELYLQSDGNLSERELRPDQW